MNSFASMNIFTKCDEILKSGRNLALATIVEASTGTPGKQGFKLILADDGELFGTVGGGALENKTIEEARAILAEGRSRIYHFNLAELGMECGGNVDMVIEYLPAVAPFILFGGGHVARALCPILQSIGYAVTVFDPRPEVADSYAELGVQVVRGEYDNLSTAEDEIRKSRYSVIATHGHRHDYDVLRQLVEFDEEYHYVGLIGSKRKVKVTLGRLEEEVGPPPPFVYSPVGIKIGALTAAEIAVAITAEVIAVKNGHSADHMRATDQDSPAER